MREVGSLIAPSFAARLRRMLDSWERQPHNHLPPKRPQPQIIGGKLRRFELKDDLSGDDESATAYVLNYDATEAEYTIGEEESRKEFELYNFIEFSGKGRVVVDEGGEDEAITDGTRGWCEKKDGRWEVVGGGGLRRFELKDDLDGDGESATAYVLNYDTTAEEYTIGEVEDREEFELYDFTGFTGKGRVVVDEGGENEAITDGTRGWCEKKDGRWEVVGSSGTLRRFELKDDLSGPGTAAAYVLDYDATAEEYTIGAEADREEFELHDFTGFSGTGRVVEGEEITDGTRGWCEKKDGRWEVVGSSNVLRRFEIKNDLSGPGTATAYVLNYDGGAYTIGESGSREEFELHDFTGFSGKGRVEGETTTDGTRGWCEKKDGRWEVVGPINNPTAIATLTAVLPYGGTAAATFNFGGSGTVTVDGWMIPNFESLAAGTKVVISKIAGTWYVISVMDADSDIALATLTTVLTPGSSATATINYGGSGSVTVHDWILNSGVPATVLSGEKIVIAKFGGAWYVISVVDPDAITLATLTSDLLSGLTASATLAYGGSGSVTVNGWFMASGDSLPTGTKIVACCIEGEWWVIQPITGDKLVLAELNDNLEYGSTAAADVTVGGTETNITVGSHLLSTGQAIDKYNKIAVGRFAGVWQYISSMGTPVATATLTATLNAGSTASATVNAGAASGSLTVQDWLMASGESLPSGTKIVVSKIGDVWYVVSPKMSASRKYGKLDAQLNHGSTATVSIWEEGADTGGNETDVELPQWISSGHIASGSWVEIFSEGGAWYVDAHYGRCKAQLTAAMTSTTSSINVDAVTVITGVNPATNTTTATVFVSNLMGWEGDDDGVCLIEHVTSTNSWIFYQVKCPT